MICNQQIRSLPGAWCHRFKVRSNLIHICTVRKLSGVSRSFFDCQPRCSSNNANNEWRNHNSCLHSAVWGQVKQGGHSSWLVQVYPKLFRYRFSVHVTNVFIVDITLDADFLFPATPHPFKYIWSTRYTWVAIFHKFFPLANGLDAMASLFVECVFCSDLPPNRYRTLACLLFLLVLCSIVAFTRRIRSLKKKNEKPVCFLGAFSSFEIYFCSILIVATEDAKHSNVFGNNSTDDMSKAKEIARAMHTCRHCC